MTYLGGNHGMAIFGVAVMAACNTTGMAGLAFSLKSWR